MHDDVAVSGGIEPVLKNDRAVLEADEYILAPGGWLVALVHEPVAGVRAVRRDVIEVLVLRHVDRVNEGGIRYPVVPRYGRRGWKEIVPAEPVFGARLVNQEKHRSLDFVRGRIVPGVGAPTAASAGAVARGQHDNKKNKNAV